MVGIPAKNVGTATKEFKPYAVEEADKDTSDNEKYSRQFYFRNW